MLNSTNMWQMMELKNMIFKCIFLCGVPLNQCLSFLWFPWHPHQNLIKYRSLVGIVCGEPDSFFVYLFLCVWSPITTRIRAWYRSRESPKWCFVYKQKLPGVVIYCQCSINFFVNVRFAVVGFIHHTNTTSQAGSGHPSGILCKAFWLV